MSSAPPPAGSGGTSNAGQSLPPPVQAENLTGYTPAGEDEIVEELAEEIADDVIDESELQAVTPAQPAPVYCPTPENRVVYTAPPPPAVPSAAPAPPAAPAAPLQSPAETIVPRVVYTSTPVAPGSAAPATAAASDAEIADEEIIEDAVVVAPAGAVAPVGAVPAAEEVPAHVELNVDLNEFSNAVASAPKVRPKVMKQIKPVSSLQSTSIPVLLTVGVLLMAPGIWSVLMLMDKGEEMHLPGADRPDAMQMAKVFWVCMPMGLLLITGAGYFFFQVRDQQRAARERHQFALDKIAAAETARVAAEHAALAQREAAAAAAAASAPLPPVQQPQAPVPQQAPQFQPLPPGQ